jgi:hypothetical protein
MSSICLLCTELNDCQFSNDDGHCPPFEFAAKKNVSDSVINTKQNIQVPKRLFRGILISSGKIKAIKPTKNSEMAQSPAIRSTDVNKETQQPPTKDWNKTEEKQPGKRLRVISKKKFIKEFMGALKKQPLKTKAG